MIVTFILSYMFTEPKSHNAYRLIEPWIGTGLLVANGGKWKRNRRLLTPAFHFDVLKNYQLIMNKTSDILLVFKKLDFHFFVIIYVLLLTYNAY